jgi:hypothetical protein
MNLMFDPYHKWLGIPKDQRPPTFYQLLGIAPDEKDLEVIEEAAIRQTTYLRGYQIGPHAQDCTRLLNEIALARATLVNAAKRAEYDGKIKPQARPATTEAAVQADQPELWTESLTDKGPPALPRTSQASSASMKKRWGIAIGAGLHLVALVLLLYYFVLRPKGDETQEVKNHKAPEEIKSPVRKPVVQQPIARQDPKPEPAEPTPKPEPKPAEPAPVVPAPPPPMPELPASPDEIQRFAGHAGQVLAVAFCPDVRRLVTGGSDNTLRLWEIETGKELRVFRGHSEAIRRLAISADGRQILSGSKDGTVRLWDLESGDQIHRFDGHANDVTGVAFLADGRHAISCSRDKTIRIWDLAMRRQSIRRLEPAEAFECLALSADGQRLVTGGTSGSLKVWDAPKLRRLASFQGHVGMILCVALSGDGRQALSGGGDGTVILWDVDTRKQIQRLAGNQAACFTPDGSRALTNLPRPDVHLWDLKTGKELCSFNGHKSATVCLTVSPDNVYALSGSWDGTARLWKLPAVESVAAKPPVVPENQPKDPPETEPEKPVSSEKSPVPDEEAQAKREKDIRELFKSDFLKDKPGDKLNLANKLTQKADETKDDVVARYVLARLARDLAVQAGNVALAIRAIDLLAKSYAVEPLEMKAETLEKMTPSASEAGSRTITDAVLVLVDSAKEADNPGLAQRLMTLAKAAADKAKSATVTKKVETKARELDEFLNEFQKIEKAEARLKEKPSDADANLTLGKYWCLKKGDWKKGLPLLAQGSDAHLKGLAEKDLAQPKEAAAQVEVGDGWWDLGEKEAGKTKQQLVVRARYWYDLAEPGVTGLTKTKLENRLKDSERVAPAAPRLTPGSIYSRVGAKREQLLREGGGNDKSEAAVSVGLKWLVRHQAPDGHWALDNFGCGCSGTGQHNDTAGTAFGLLPLLGNGDTHRRGLYAKNVEKGVNFLLRKQNKNGDLGGGMYAHALATIALCEDYALTGDPVMQKPVQAAINYIVLAQSDNGGWRYTPRGGGDTSVTGWQFMALKTGQMARLKIPQAVWAGASRWFDSCMSADGSSYGYTGAIANAQSNATTAIGLLCRQYMGWDTQKPGLLAGISNLKNNHRELERNVYFDYYATEAIYHVGGENWNAWNSRMRDKLIATQDKGEVNPHQAGSWDPRGDTYGGAGGRLMVTSLSILTLEVYYRHVPLNRKERVAAKD